MHLKVAEPGETQLSMVFLSWFWTDWGVYWFYYEVYFLFLCVHHNLSK